MLKVNRAVDEDYISFIESLKDTSSAGTRNAEVVDALPATGSICD